MFSKKHAMLDFDDAVTPVEESLTEFKAFDESEIDAPEQQPGDLSITADYIEPTVSYSGESCEKSLPQASFDAAVDINIPSFTNDTQTSSSSVECQQDQGSSFNFFDILEAGAKTLSQGTETPSQSTEAEQTSFYGLIADTPPVSPLEFDGSTSLDHTPCHTPSLTGVESTPYQNQSSFTIQDSISPIFANTSFVNLAPLPLDLDQDVFGSTLSLNETVENQDSNVTLSNASVSVATFSVFSGKSFSGDATQTYLSEDKNGQNFDMKK